MSGVYPYPLVLDEFETIRQCASGKSIARVGDGEWALMRGSTAAREGRNEHLARELRDVLASPHKDLLPCVPTMNPSGPKYPSWKKHIPHVLQFFEEGVTYGSAFISRPDSSPWIENLEYCLSVQNLWKDKRVVLVAESTACIVNTVAHRSGAPSHFTLVECPHQESYSVIGHLHKHILRAAPDFVVLSCGPAATALAHRLCKNGVHTLDIGSAGRFLARNLWPKQPQEK